MTIFIRNPLVPAVLALGLFCLSSAARADTLVTGDLSVRPNLCVGEDCLDSESYPSTMLLKGENLRINFDDTTVVSSYAKQDWDITINDPGAGGSAYFAVSQDGWNMLTLQADAVTELEHGLGQYLRIDSGDTPRVRLNQGAGGALTPYVWDIAANESGFSISDATGGGAPFLILPGAAANSVVVRGSRLGVKVNNPNAALDVGGDSIVRGDLEVASSRDCKRDIRPLAEDEARDALMDLSPVHFRYKVSPNRPQLGFIAEEMPELAASPGRKGVSPMNLVAILARTTQVQQRILEEQRQVLDDQAARIEALEERLADYGLAAER